MSKVHFCVTRRWLTFKKSSHTLFSLLLVSFFFLLLLCYTMGKVNFAPNPETSAVITSASSASGILLSGFDNSAAAEHFALVTHGLDRHRLRIFNVRSGTVNNDYTADDKERFTCLSWGSIRGDGELGQVNWRMFRWISFGLLD